MKTIYLEDLSIGSGRYGIGASAVDYNPNLPTYLRITDIRDDGTLDLSSKKSVEDPEANNYMLRPGDIVFARTGNSTGRNYFYDERDGAFAYAGFLIKFSLDPEKVNPRYVKYYAQSKPYWDWVASFNTGSTRGNINAKTYGKLPILLPEREKQDAIVLFCDSISDKIRINSQLNDYLAELLLALQKQIAETEELTESRADEVFNIHIGKTPPRKEPEWFSFDRDGNVIWMSIKDMGGGDTYLIDSSEYLTPEAVDKHNIKKCKPGSVLLSFKLTVGRVGIVASEMVTNEAIACFSSDDPRKLAYLYPLLKSYDYASLGSTSSIATAVNSKMIKAMGLKIPSSTVLDAFYERAKPIYELLLSNTREIAALNELRDTLLPKLMSGEIDVSKVDLTQLNNHLSVILS